MRHVIQPGHFSSSLRSYIQTLQDPLKFVLAAGIGTLLLVSLVVLRIYLVSQVLHQEGENNLCQKKGENKVAYPVVVSSGKAVNCVPFVGMELFW